MPRLTKLEEAMFHVSENPVAVRVTGKDGVQHIQVPGKKAILYEKNVRVLGIVSGGYRRAANSPLVDELARVLDHAIFMDRGSPVPTGMAAQRKEGCTDHDFAG